MSFSPQLGKADERPLEFESAPENGKKKIDFFFFFFDQMKTIRRIQFWFVFAKSETLDIFSRFGLGKCQDEMDSVDFAAFLSHPTGEDWWRRIRRFQEPIAAWLSNRPITLLQPMGFSAAGQKPHFLRT